MREAEGDARKTEEAQTGMALAGDRVRKDWQTGKYYVPLLSKEALLVAGPLDRCLI
jgi:hypothetical protein